MLNNEVYVISISISNESISKERGIAFTYAFGCDVFEPPGSRFNVKSTTNTHLTLNIILALVDQLVPV